ncbi:UDP-glucose:undecaprenyl-phosphate glucose-1-phosphate transferase [Phycisphaerae bacterium RAS1]|nr:UDP-glucose:undecaprenyl-phosphate glucose-1-phosphate transferase [Phycisphaerae bacterium RAS1]
MLKQHNQLAVGFVVLADGAAIAIAWLVSYWLRFTFLHVDAAKGVPDLGDKYLPMLPLVVLAHLAIFYKLRLYRPRRSENLLRETRDVIQAFVVAVVVVVLIDYAMPASHKISRQFVATYAVVGTTCFALFRGVVRLLTRLLRARGWNQRYAAIVGSGRNAQRLMHALHRNAWTGIRVAYFVDDVDDEKEAPVRGLPVYGPLGRTRQIIESRPVDSVFIALPAAQSHRSNDVLTALETVMADVRVVPEIDPAYALRPNVSELDGVPVLSLRQTPLYGWNALAKRSFDLVVGAACLVIGAIPMLLIAAAIKLGSRGPVFYRQRRMSLDGSQFDMFKFRTMVENAEAGSGPKWADRDDPRRTRVGAFLRRTSLDELPNLFNVLAGDMSLVGPRPERPEFIEQFKDEIPRYMLRHRMKAGMTGYAQVKGLRGQSSLKKRIQHDVHYIRNWSLMLDVRILLRTVFGVWFSKHEA